MDLLGHKLLKPSIFNLQKRNYHQKKAILIWHLFFVKFVRIGCKMNGLYWLKESLLQIQNLSATEIMPFVQHERTFI